MKESMAQFLDEKVGGLNPMRSPVNEKMLHLGALRPDEVLHPGLLVDNKGEVYEKFARLCPLAVYYAATLLLGQSGKEPSWVGPPAVVFSRGEGKPDGILAGAEMVAAACLLGIDIEVDRVRDARMCRAFNKLNHVTFGLNCLNGKAISDNLKRWRDNGEEYAAYQARSHADEQLNHGGRFLVESRADALLAENLPFEGGWFGSGVFDPGLWYGITGNLALPVADGRDFVEIEANAGEEGARQFVVRPAPTGGIGAKNGVLMRVCRSGVMSWLLFLIWWGRPMCVSRMFMLLPPELAQSARSKWIL